MKKRKNKSYYLIPGVQDFYSPNIGIVEVDPEIALIVQCLNYKGYATKASCAGHMNEIQASGRVYGYIWVETLPQEPLPSGLYSEPSSAGKGHCIRWITKSERGLKLAHTELENWVHKIEPLD